MVKSLMAGVFFLMFFTGKFVTQGQPEWEGGNGQCTYALFLLFCHQINYLLLLSF